MVKLIPNAILQTETERTLYKFFYIIFFLFYFMLDNFF